ncbi:MAG TPA: bifunctional phosphopantothenoylcysteine decarboxylase/phosphopantothenate--cysteine ligase CoaBC [Flavobacteriales bacterium]|jgi:phosphopantothenoylcysteine decarboxylase/phosphopantothenate--cysteine ligase|nr:bifunctional phosphopantothenoylcysteine decarboxylase/phosphopantothenate--cysteine ligase CoaBC [Flavobacteriales bacterium]|tara:strand:- start:8627 stop:9826 length:1200 start_codon:yes stop_codon:yes gene_type:complete
MLKSKNVILGVTASIAAYKSAFIVREFKKAGALVKVIQTDASLDFVTPLTLSTLSENTVLTKMVEGDTKDWISHVDLAQWADLLLIAPVTAKTMAKMVAGECDSLLLATYLSAKCPVYFAPAMDLDMYKHSSTKQNIEKLISFGNKFIAPTFGELASGLVGKGRMAEPEDIIDFIKKDLSADLPLSRKKVLITAGPTYEPIDPVRFIGNHSSGKMGYHLAMQAAKMGAEVTLIMGPSDLKVENSNVLQINVKTAKDMQRSVKDHFEDADIAIFSAAVSDYKIENIASQKVKKSNGNWDISLTKTNDILLEISQEKKENQILVGFALETENELENAKEKLINKNLDMIVLNSLNEKGAGFGYDSNKITIIEKDNKIEEFELKHKREVAKDIISKIILKIS